MRIVFLKNFWIVFTKELAEALRDRRTLMRLLVPAVLMGPLLLLALSTLISSLEQRAEKREMLVVGIENTERRRDLTGPTREARDLAIAPRVGGSAAFRGFLREALMPELNS